MKNPQISISNNSLFKGDAFNAKVDIKLLGYLSVIGFDVRKILEGKNLYERLKKITDKHKIRYNWAEEENNTWETQVSDLFIKQLNIAKLVLNLDTENWEHKKLDFKVKKNEYSPVFENEKEYAGSLYSDGLKIAPEFLNKLEYALLEQKKSEVISKSSTEELILTIKQVEKWLSEYLEPMEKASKKNPALSELLKIIISH